MTTTRLFYSEGLETPNGKENGKTALVSYIILNLALKNGKVHTRDLGNMRSS